MDFLRAFSLALSIDRLSLCAWSVGEGDFGLCGLTTTTPASVCSQPPPHSSHRLVSVYTRSRLEAISVFMLNTLSFSFWLVKSPPYGFRFVCTYSFVSTFVKRNKASVVCRRWQVRGNRHANLARIRFRWDRSAVCDFKDHDISQQFVAESTFFVESHTHSLRRIRTSRTEAVIHNSVLFTLSCFQRSVIVRKRKCNKSKRKFVKFGTDRKHQTVITQKILIHKNKSVQ